MLEFCFYMAQDFGAGSKNLERPVGVLIAKRNRIRNCMKEKGYIVYGFEQCGLKKSPTGLCSN